MSALEKSLSGFVGEVSKDSETYDTVQKISKFIERPEIYPVRTRKNTVPKVGELVLINERDGVCFSREHGGRYRNEYMNSRRYFGEVVQVYPHIVVMRTPRGIVSERVWDFKLGILRYAKLKKFPESLKTMSYDERLLGTFIKAFESLLEQ